MNRTPPRLVVGETADAMVSEPPRRDQSLWPVALIVVIPALLLAVILYAAQSVGGGSGPDALDVYRVVHTRFGDAIVACGGDVTTKCDRYVGLKFAQQTPELLAYFDPGYAAAAPYIFDKAYFDRLARAVAGNPPPGTQWTVFTCPGARWDVALFGS